MRRPFACLAALSLASCATVYRAEPFPTYEYVGIDLGATITGNITLSEKCLLMQRDIDGPAVSPVTLIMPLGTRLAGNSLILPAENGGETISFGSNVTFQGGYTTIDGTTTWNRNPGGCAGSAFIINRTYP